LSKSYIVVFDDEGGLCTPFGPDPDCEGALQYSNDGVALFPSHAAAKTAIKISVKYAELLMAQGKPANTDFVGDAKKFIKIRPCQAMPEIHAKKT
jgi:hypothetical protein